MDLITILLAIAITFVLIVLIGVGLAELWDYFSVRKWRKDGIIPKDEEVPKIKELNKVHLNALGNTDLFDDGNRDEELV